jgi:hypothetical protein
VNAIFADDSSKIRSLLELGIDVNDRGFFNIPPLISGSVW